MKILHYFLGFPPYRSGGMTRFVMDLMESQVSDGDEVYALWPGRMSGGIIKCRKHRKVRGINNIELINPLPVPLDEGIASPDKFMGSGNIREFSRYFDRILPDIIHVHTLMGLHKEAVEYFKNRAIPIVYTTHDYFGIGFKPVFINDYEILQDKDSLERTAAENAGGLSYSKIKLLQSPIYRTLKNSPPVRYIRKKHRKKFHNITLNHNLRSSDDITNTDEYALLKDYYRDILRMVDAFHYNSEISCNIYSSYLSGALGRIIYITHKNIHDRRKIREYGKDARIKFAYMAQPNMAKGFFFIRECFDSLWEEGFRNFSLKLFFPVEEAREYMEIKEEGYVFNELGQIYDDVDVVLVPSIWYETFGFITLESLSYGVPVLVSDRVGAKGILMDGCGRILPCADHDVWKKAIKDIDADTLKKWNENICACQNIIKWDSMADDIRNLYMGLVEK